MADIPDELRPYYESYKARFEREQAKADDAERTARAIIASEGKRLSYKAPVADIR